MMEALIAYRRIKARETLVDAHILAKDGSPSSALNRIYYAMFYEVLALLLTKGLSAAKHTGVRALFNEHFVKPGLVSVDLGRLFSRMFDFRQKCDYGDFVKITKENIAEWLEQAVVFVDGIRGQIYFLLRCAQDGLLVHCPHWSDGRISSHSPATMVSYIQAA